MKFVEVPMKAAVLIFAAGLISSFIGTSHSSVLVRIMGATMSVAGTVRDRWRAGVPKADKTEAFIKSAAILLFWLTFCILARY